MNPSETASRTIPPGGNGRWPLGRRWVIWLLVVVCGVTMLLLPACAVQQKEPRERISVRLKWIVQGQFAGLLVAKDKGFFEKYNLDVTIHPGGVDLNPIKLVASGADQIGISTADQIILARAQGIQLTGFAAVFQKSPVVMFALKSSGVESPRDFLGKTVGMKYGYSDETLFNALVKKLELDPSKIKLVPVRYFDLALFLAGKVQVWPGYSTNEPILVQEHGKEVNVFHYDDYGIYLYADTFFASEELISKKPAVVERFLRAAVEGWKWTTEHPEQASDILLKYNNQLDRGHELRMIQECIRLINTGDALTHGIGWMDPKKWKAAHDLMFQAKLLDKPIDLERAYTMGFLEKLYPSGK